MTEAEWLASTDPTPMIELLKGKASDRKLRLFCCGCSRSIWHLIPDSRSRSAVDTVERFVDGQVSEDEFRNAEKLALEAEEESNGTETETMTETGSAAVSYTFQTMNINTVQHVAEFAYSEYACPASMPELNRNAIDARADEERKRQARILRDIFDNPFRIAAVESEWLTTSVVVLANGIYADRAFDQMPILADALQDAGCDNDDILNHCRQPGEHVRGCWVVDLLLGKS